MCDINDMEFERSPFELSYSFEKRSSAESQLLSVPLHQSNSLSRLMMILLPE